MLLIVQNEREYIYAFANQRAIASA
jgi:hypothetical protein